MSKKLISLIIILLSLLTIFFIIQQNNLRDQDKYSPPLSNIDLNKTKDIVPQIKKTTLYFVGDIMMTRGVKNSVLKNFNSDYNRIFENLDELKKADILFGNLEGAVSDKGNNVGSKYSFRMDPEILPVLKNAGFDIVSFANNHIGDWNITAFKDSLARLDEIGILKTGAGYNKLEAEKPTIIERNNIKFGFLGFSDVGPNWMEAKIETPGILLASDPRLSEIIQNAKELCDVLIVSFHFGEEYKLIHNARQETLSHTAVDNGADLVIGHHPHVIQDIETYKDKVIVYSLGNFIFDQYFSDETMQGMLFIATFEGNILKETKILTNLLNKKYQSEGLFNSDSLIDKKEVLSSNCPKPNKEYENMFYLNIGQNISLPDKTYIPKNLVELGDLAISNNLCLTQESKKALARMIKAAQEDNIQIKVTSAFRDFSYQENLLLRAMENNRSNISNIIAKAGHSEHQLGTAVDLSGDSLNYLSVSNFFYNTPEELWLRENAHKFGFVQSYPKDKEDITGYIYEPWHYRYLGVQNALAIKDSGLTINEFLQQKY